MVDAAVFMDFLETIAQFQLRHAQMIATGEDFVTAVCASATANGEELTVQSHVHKTAHFGENAFAECVAASRDGQETDAS
jgi:hypothetical protein